MLITSLPFGLPGKVYTSPMPFGLYDNEGKALEEFTENGVSVVVLLVETFMTFTWGWVFA